MNARLGLIRKGTLHARRWDRLQRQRSALLASKRCARPLFRWREVGQEGHKDGLPDVVEPFPMRPGRPERVDYESERLGTANLFVMVEPGYRHVEATADYAHQLQWLAEVRYPEAKKIRLVQDNLNTHRLASLYVAFPPEEALRLLQRFAIHPTPIHGSWLNMAEVEIGIFERSCLCRRVEAIDALKHHVATLEAERSAAQAAIAWRFITSDARVKLGCLYEVRRV